MRWGGETNTILWQKHTNQAQTKCTQKKKEEDEVETSEWMIMQGVMWGELSRHNIHIQSLGKS